MKPVIRSNVFVLASVLAACSPPQLCKKTVVEKCGTCDPAVERIASALEASGLGRAALKEAKSCLDSDTALSYMGEDVVKAATKTCIERKKDFDPEVRALLVRMVESTQTDPKQHESWSRCGRCKLHDDKSSCGGTGPRVVLMDSHVPENVYCESTRRSYGSNATDVWRLISDLQVSEQVIPTNLAWQGEQKILDNPPSLVIIHASAFQETTASFEANRRLELFLRTVAGAKIPVMVYTRGPTDESAEATLERWNELLAVMNDPEVGKYAQMYRMEKGADGASCFDDPIVGAAFKAEVRRRLAALE